MRCMIDSKSAGSLACSAGLMACTLERLSASAGLKVHLCRYENMHEYVCVYMCICMYVYVWSSDRDGMELSPKDNQRGSSDLMMDGNCRRKTLRGVIRPTEGTGSSVETTTRGQQTSGWALPSLQGVIRSTDGTCQQLQGIGWRPLEQDKTASDGDGGPSSKTKRLAIGMEAPSSNLDGGTISHRDVMVTTCVGGLRAHLVFFGRNLLSGTLGKMVFKRRGGGGY